MPEMIKYLTKKFSSHSLTEVKAAERFTLQGHSSKPEERKDYSHRSHEGGRESERRLSLESLEAEDEEISTINLCTTAEHPRPPPGQLPKNSPKLQDQSSEQPASSSNRYYGESRPAKPPPLRHITPPLKQFEMRLPGIETDQRKAIKPRKKCFRHTSQLRSLESPLLRRAAFQEKEAPRPSAFIRIPHIEGAKIHPRSEKHCSKEKRSSKEISSIAEKIVISKPMPATESVKSRDIPARAVERETSHSDSEVSDTKSSAAAQSGACAVARRSDSFTGKKSPSPSLSAIERESYNHGFKSAHCVSYSNTATLRRTPSPLDKHSPPQFLQSPLSRHSPSRHSPSLTRISPTPAQRFEYKCFTTLSNEQSSHESEKLATLLERSKTRFTPIHMGEGKRSGEDDDRKRECSRSPQLLSDLPATSNTRFLMERIPQRKSWDKPDVEMVETLENDRNAMHHSRLNAAYSKDLKRKYSVVPVDDEVRSICAATSKSNFKAFILTSNQSQSSPSHRTIDISVVRPNKRVCCTDGSSPPSIRRPSINVEKMAQTVIVRRPTVRKAGNSNRVWSTKEKNHGEIRVPVPIRGYPIHSGQIHGGQHFDQIPTSTN